MTRLSSLPLPFVIIIISGFLYKYFKKTHDFLSLTCPVCNSSVKYHGKYTKLYYLDPIRIQRVRCTNSQCKKTHALIPEKSVPYSSIGANELAKFITFRRNGRTIADAGYVFVKRGMSPEYPEYIHRSLKKTINRLLVIFIELESYRFTYSELLYQAVSPDVKIDSSWIAKIHSLCYEKGFHPVLFSRYDNFHFGKNKEKIPSSHNSDCMHPP